MKKANIVTDGTKRNKHFEAICSMSQEQLKLHLKEKLKSLGRKVVDADGFLYSEGSFPVMLCAHLDTVHKELPKTIVYEKGKISSPQGIGGDDRCGIYMILELLKTHPDIHVCFFEEEEHGGIGSTKFTATETCNSLIGKLNYVIELDRANSRDAVYYSQDNYDFEKFIEKEFFEIAYGSFTDICHICPTLECAGVNLSCGYYNQHTVKEYVCLKEMETVVEEVRKLLDRTTEADKFEYIEYVSKGKWSDLYGYGNYGYSDYYYGSYYKRQTTKGKEEEYDIYFSLNKEHCIATVSAVSTYEAIGKFLVDHEDMSYSDILTCVRV